MKFKKLLSLGLAFVLCFTFFVPLSVSAATFNGLEFSTDEFSANRTNILNTLMALRDNDSIDLDDYYCFISSYSSGSIFLLDKSYTSVTLYNGVPDYFCQNGRYFSIVYQSDTVVFRNTFVSTMSLSDLSNYDFSQVNFYSSYKCDVTLYSFTGGIGKIYDAVDSTVGKSYEFWQAANVVNQCTSYGSSEVYIPNVFYTGVHFSYDADDFYDWIINNNKLSSLPSYIVQSKLKSFLTFYQSYGSSASSFFRFIPEWFSYMNIANQSNENVNILKGSIDNLYKQYIEYRNSRHAYWPGAIKLQERNDIDTKTDNNNTTLITDTVNDDDITLILRDILRGVIAIPNQLFTVGQNIISALDSLSFDVVVSNNGGAPSGTDIDPLLQKMDDIIEALQADTVSVDIDQTIQDDTDQFFNDWNLEFKSALDSKFPVATQLSTLFTDFWEKCGVDVDNDGETFEFYSPGVLESRSEVRSLSSAGSSETDIVSDFLDQFDDSDPAFLDDASFNSVPDFSVSVGGSDVSIFDFRVYAKYRDKIHFIISLVIWSLYLLHLYKALPTIIGQVADVAVKVTDD